LFSPGNRRAAREAAGRSLVLLRNKGQVLPFAKDLATLAVIGPLADDKAAMLGSWTGDGRASDAVSVLEGIRAAVSPKTQVLYCRGCELQGAGSEAIAQAVAVARRSKAVVLVLGEGPDMSGEASSRSDIGLPGRQVELARSLAALGVPLAVVLVNGRPLALSGLAEAVPALLEAWQPGSEGGQAVADGLFGVVNPGGKLPASFPRSVGQEPLYYNHKNTGRPTDDKSKYTSRYLDAPSTPLYPFGFGLSYTDFVLSGLSLSADSIPADGRLTVSVQVENNGRRAGDEVVQLYIRDLAASATRPVRELKGFQRLSLAPGEERTVVFQLGPQELGFYGLDGRFTVEPGRFQLFVGDSSVAGLEASFRVLPRGS
jgi:beta-glucosidase